ncbi:MAG: ATP synthase subunit I [Desulfobacterales bacterium]|nr:ATP synthase subunit I [Desulfobacterales bacterium]
MDIQKRIITFVKFSNWILFILATIISYLYFSFGVTKGVFFGGAIVTINFHLLAKTLKKSLTPPYLTSHNVVIAKYYIRFLINGFIIFFLLSNHYVNPIGLFIGLSVVVVSIMLAAANELMNLVIKEAI